MSEQLILNNFIEIKNLESQLQDSLTIKLNSNNWYYFNKQLKDVLTIYDLNGLIEDPPGEKKNKFDLMIRKFILNLMDDEHRRIFESAYEIDSAYATYEKLKEMHTPVTRKNSMNQLSKILTTKWNYSDSFDQSITDLESKIKLFVAQLDITDITKMKEKLTEDIESYVIIQNIKNNMDHLVHQFNTNLGMTIKDLKINIREYRSMNKKNEAQVLLVEETCKYCGKRHESIKCWTKFPNLRPKNKFQSKKKKKETKNVMLINQSKVMAEKKNEDSTEFLIDSGAADHFCTELNKFQSLDSTKMNITLANGFQMTIQGKGNVGKLREVYYAPTFTHNLLSAAKLCDQGYTVLFNSHGVSITNKTKNITVLGERKNDKYVVNVMCDRSQVLQIKKEINLVKLWHLRLGHISDSKLAILSKENKMIGKMLEDFDVKAPCKELCEGCLKGKMKDYDHNRVIKREQGPFTLAYTDLATMDISSYSNFQYVCVIIDDATRYAYVHFLRNKSEVLNAYTRFNASVVESNGFKLRKLRMDNGEGKSTRVEEWLTSIGAVAQYTPPYSSKSNGIAERLIQTLRNLANAIRFQAGFNEKMWAECWKSACYLYNRIPNLSNHENKSPYEMLFKVKPDLSILKIIGCRAFVYVPKALRKKSEPKCKEGRMIGYSEDSKGYRI